MNPVKVMGVWGPDKRRRVRVIALDDLQSGQLSDLILDLLKEGKLAFGERWWGDLLEYELPQVSRA